MKTITGPTIRQERLESFNQDCLDLFKDLSVDSLISRILYIAATWTNSCYCVCGLTSSRRGRFSSYKLYGFTPSEIKLLNAGQKDAILSIPSDEIICTENESECRKYRIFNTPDDEFSLNVLISYDSTILPNQYATLEDMTLFKDEVAKARTFVFVREIEPLLQLGLIKGGDLDNAIVIYERQMTQDKYDQLADVMGVPHMDATQLGYIMHKPLVWPNECARHKLLDLIGDMALIGKPIKGRIIATRPGHTVNNKFAREMRRQIRQHSVQAPKYDVNAAPLMDVNKIRQLIPHRYPMLLVDKIVEIGPDYIVGVKNITGNEPYFQGHFPLEPVMPGVLLIEAMAQTGGLLVLNQVDELERYSTYVLKINNVKFRKKVVPGDTLVFKIEMIQPLHRGLTTMRGYAFVGEDEVCEAEVMAQVVKNK